MKDLVATKQEKDQKKAYAETMKDLEAKRKANKVGKDTYDMIEKYWTKQRTIAHKQYHNVLKIAHAGIQRFKDTIGAMKEAMAGKKLDSKTAQTLQLEAPEVVFLSLATKVRALDTWARGAEKEAAPVTPAASEKADAKPGIDAMEKKLRGIADGMKKVSSKGQTAGFAAMAKIATEAEEALANVEKAKDPEEKRKLLEAALGPEGVGTWMQSLTGAAV